MPECKQRVLLLSHTPDAQAQIALGARLCYAGGNVDKLMEKVSRQDQQAFLEKLMSMGHESVLEHVSFTFLIEGVSRVLLAQLTRHRIASFSVQSQRYVSYKDGFGYIVPPPLRRWARTQPPNTGARWRKCSSGTRNGRNGSARRAKRATRTRASCCREPARPASC